MIQNKKALIFAVALVAVLFLPDVASAVPQLNQAGLRFGRLGISAATNNDLLVTVKLRTTPTSVRKVKITFPSGFNITTAGLAVAATPSTIFPSTPAITGLPGTLSIAGTTNGSNLGGTITVTTTSTTLDSSTLYGFIIASGNITNPSSAGQYLLSVDSQDATPTTIDSTPVATYIYGASANQDQVTVTASVAPLFTFTLSGNNDIVPQADKNTVVTSPGVTLTIATNAPLGYTAYVKSANAALDSANTSGTIPTGTFNGSPDSVVAGTSSYTFVPSSGTVCVGGCNGSSVITYDGEYNGITGASGGSFNAAGSFASFVSRNGFTGTDNFSLKERVAVSAVQAAATDYTDTLTIVAAGNY
ncbi:MAG: hypothetical protein JWO41_493 [Candidatus Saccharibacteria bacterium]|nr:hypothetical protein [Candidatus Saccharibacteria bacterium]